MEEEEKIDHPPYQSEAYGTGQALPPKAGPPPEENRLYRTNESMLVSK